MGKRERLYLVDLTKSKEVIVNAEESIKVKYSKCEHDSEGGPHCLGMDVVTNKFKFTVQNNEFCKPYGCIVVSANIIDNNIWIGFGSRGEYQWYGDGVQAYDISTYALKFSSSKDQRYFASGFVKHPTTGKIIIPSDQGIHEIDLQKNNEETIYSIWLDFDNDTKKIRRMMSKDAHEDNILAMIGKKLGYEDNISFYDSMKMKIAGKNLYKYLYKELDDFFKDFDLKKELSPFIAKSLKSKDEQVKKNAEDLLVHVNSNK
jgi:hypothetical protein